MIVWMAIFVVTLVTAQRHGVTFTEKIARETTAIPVDWVMFVLKNYNQNKRIEMNEVTAS